MTQTSSRRLYVRARPAAEREPLDPAAQSDCVNVVVPADVVERLQRGEQVRLVLLPRRSSRAAVAVKVAVYLAVNPGASGNAVHRAIGGRRADVLRAVRSLRAARVVDEAELATAAAPTRYLSSGYQQSGELPGVRRGGQ